jgi:hypothetical protein
MATYDNTFTGAAWLNGKLAKKIRSAFHVQGKKSEKHPDFTGYINWNGKERFVSIWMNLDADNGKPQMRMSIGGKRSKK